VRTLLVWLTGAAGLALSFSLLALAGAGGALLLRVAWQLVNGALPGDAGAKARQQLLRDAPPPTADAEGPRRFMRTRRPDAEPPASPLRLASDAAPAAPRSDDDVARLERLGTAALAVARWALPSFAALAALAAAATQPAAVERAAVALFTAAFTVAAAAVGTAAAVSAAALAISVALRRARAALAEDAAPRVAAGGSLRLPSLWQPDFTQPLPGAPSLEEASTPRSRAAAGEAMLPPPWAPPPPPEAQPVQPAPPPPAAEPQPTPATSAVDDAFARAALAARAAAVAARTAALREAVARDGLDDTDGDSLSALRQRAKAAYFSTKAWRNTGRGGSGSAGRKASNTDAGADAGFEERRAARADWQRRVQRAQGAPEPPWPTPPRAAKGAEAE
jgi:hypothetical protein